MHLNIGKDENGNEITHDFGKLPVILMAGATGSGKSNLTQHFTCSLIQQFSVEELKLVLFDCKQVEFYNYKNSAYLFNPVGVCTNADLPLFEKLENEIEKRKQNSTNKPYIFIAIDEYSDLMSYCPDKLERLIELIAEHGSMVGIGLVLSTSRPGKDVITEKIDKAVQTRIGLVTASDNDSETIIHQKGCAALLGKGDGLYLRYIDSEPVHFQTPLITEEEIEKIVVK